MLTWSGATASGPSQERNWWSTALSMVTPANPEHARLLSRSIEPQIYAQETMPKRLPCTVG